MKDKKTEVEKQEVRKVDNFEKECDRLRIYHSKLEQQRIILENDLKMTKEEIIKVLNKIKQIEKELKNG